MQLAGDAQGIADRCLCLRYHNGDKHHVHASEIHLRLKNASASHGQPEDSCDCDHLAGLAAQCSSTIVVCAMLKGSSCWLPEEQLMLQSAQAGTKCGSASTSNTFRGHNLAGTCVGMAT